MHRLFVEPELLDGETLVLRGGRARKLSRVLRLGAGDAVRIFDGRGTERDATIVEAGAGSVSLRLGARETARAPAGPAVWLLQALPRGDKLDWVVEKATELGVSRVVPVRAGRSITRGARGEAFAQRLSRWRRIAAEAARQSGRADVPVVDAPVDLAGALAAPPADALRIVLWEEARQNGSPLVRVLRESGRPPAVALLVGPEGGFGAGEIEAARACGFIVAHLGRSILRTETAALAACAAVAWELGDLGGDSA